MLLLVCASCCCAATRPPLAHRLLLQLPPLIGQLADARPARIFPARAAPRPRRGTAAARQTCAPLPAAAASALRSRPAARSAPAPFQSPAGDNQAAARPRRAPLSRLPDSASALRNSARSISNSPARSRSASVCCSSSVALRLQPRFPLGDLRFAALDLRQAVVAPALSAMNCFDVAIELRLALIQFAMPRFDRGFALLQPLVPLVPGGAVVVQARPAAAQARLRAARVRPRRFGQRGSRARRALLRELASAPSRELRPPPRARQAPARGRRSPRPARRAPVAARRATAAHSATWLRGRPLEPPARLAAIERRTAPPATDRPVGPRARAVVPTSARRRADVACRRFAADGADQLAARPLAAAACGSPRCNDVRLIDPHSLVGNAGFVGGAWFGVARHTCVTLDASDSRECAGKVSVIGKTSPESPSAT